MNEKNYYHLLDLPDFSDIDTIKNKYKQLVKMHHPDKGGNREDFDIIKQAYDYLKNPNSKEEYDRNMKCNIWLKKTRLNYMIKRRKSLFLI
jgi:molecular chaperone DnaJ